LAKSRNKKSRQKVWLCKHVKKISTFSKHWESQSCDYLDSG
jgi:hypothetical protein